VSSRISDELARLLRSLSEERSPLDRVIGRDRRKEKLAAIAASRDIRLVPALLPFLASDDSLRPHVARVIAELVRGIAPAALGWLDEQVRQEYYRSRSWEGFAPDAVSRLARTVQRDPVVLGIVASHRNGFVRAAALEVLAECTDGREIPFLTLRANDWVAPVAARARELLIARLRPNNRRAVLDALPFLVRVRAQQRRDPGDIERSFCAVLISDGGEEALAHAPRFDTRSRRILYEMLLADAAPSRRRRIVDAALSDPDVLVRWRAVGALAGDSSASDRIAVLERLLSEDPVPAIRRRALSLISERFPERIPGLFPDVVLDRSAGVRDLARFIARAHRLAIVPREVYVAALGTVPPDQIAAAIAGVGETGTLEDADLVAPFLRSDRSRIRRSALLALARLDDARAVPAAAAALADEAAPVRGAAVDILATHANRVDFAAVSDRMRSHRDPRARVQLLSLLARAPKWEAASFLLEALADPDSAVCSWATELVNVWVRKFTRSQVPPSAAQLERIRARLDAVAPSLSADTVRLLRFSVESR
jgi:HEAT repeat protein